MNTIKSMICLLGSLLIISCDNGPKGAYGFTLPDGDAEVGQQYFVKFKCIDCHTVSGLGNELLIPEDNKPLMNVKLGGKSTRIVTYGELVTSIINPSHKISNRYSIAPMSKDGESMMRNYNDIMTVDELIDIVAFVQGHYKLMPYRVTKYGTY